MRPLGRIADHLLRVKRMARAAELDLVEAHTDGVLSQQDWADIVQTCRGCSWAPQCDAWVNKVDKEGCAPATCLNRARFEELRRRKLGAVG